MIPSVAATKKLMEILVRLSVMELPGIRKDLVVTGHGRKYFGV